MKQKIMVTGGSGYVGSWIVKGLLENGHTVRMTVRNKENKSKYEFLEKIAADSPGSLEIWEADLLVPGSFDEAAKGCDAIAHVAAVFKLQIKDAKKDLYEPSLNGTINVLEAANRSGSVKKVVLTSSVAAVYGDNIDMKEQNISAFTEEHFNTTSTLDHQAYSFSKVEAEKKAWEMAKEQSSWELVVINPSFVMGPPLSKNTGSYSLTFVNDLLSGKLKSGAVELYFGFVDVRDVAKAHIFALENKADGRHILVAKVLNILSFANIIRDLYGDQFKLPRFNNPKWLISIIGGLFGLTRKFVKRNVGYPIRFDTSKSREKLELEYTPMEKTIEDMVEVMRS
jgi:nucleoside-diphosphate-sugar epimerase